MSSSYSKELLKTGIIEAKSGNKDVARRYLDRAIYMATSHDVMSEGWFWMSEVSDEAGEKRKALENCLAHDMYHARARRALAILDGKLIADDVINPDKLSSDPNGLQKADADRFMCPKCGGRMVFSPDGQSLVCEYCTRNHGLDAGVIEEEKDFIIAMATAKGHGRPLQEQVFHCNGCGAEFILSPGQLSATCVYCGSPHVVNLNTSKDLLAPDGIIPHAFDQKQAENLLTQWVEDRKIKPEKKWDVLRGLYLPLWTFDVGGMIEFTYEMVENPQGVRMNNEMPRMITVLEHYPVLEDDKPILASRKLSSVFQELISSYELKSLKAYDPRYLSNWPAEIYDVPMADASLEARSQVYKSYRDFLPSYLTHGKIIHTSSARIVIESFKLNLLPVWMTELHFGGREHLVLINGQSGVVASDLPSDEDREEGGLLDFLADILKE